MERGYASKQGMPIIVPRIDDPASVSADERDEHLMLIEAARHHLDVEWTETLAAAEAAGDHDLHVYPSTVAYLEHRLQMAGWARPSLCEERPGRLEACCNVCCLVRGRSP